MGAAGRYGCFALLSICPVTASLAGYYFEATTTTEASGLGRNQNVAVVHAWVNGGNARVEFQSGDATGMFREGTYLLSLEDSDIMYLVNPAEETIAEINLNEMFAIAGSIMEATGGLVQMQFSDFANEKLEEAPGEPILGYETMRYKFHTGYTMSVSVFGINRESRTTTDTEFWCTDEIDMAGFRAWLRPDRFRTGNEEIDEMISQQYGQIDCLPLRTNTTTMMSSGGGGGSDSSSTSSTEVTELREEEIASSTFELPTDYTQTTLIPDLSSLTGASPAADDDGTGAENEGRQMPRLRDLFNR